ncbi:MAG: hypothetical protein ABW043_16815 [Devosia sp.]|uniref:hypothetical protein n=1 Tax=Devosia sp. TaxID=1871048 RepID=UPI003392D0FE
MGEKPKDQIAAALQRRSEALMMNALGTSVVANTAPQEPLTLDKIHRMMLALPPRHEFLQSRLFPNDSAFVVEAPGVIYTLAGPDFWAKVRYELNRIPAKPAGAHGTPFGFNMTPIEIDPWPEDSEETAKWRAAFWHVIREALEVAMVPLPDWLRPTLSNKAPTP